MGLKNAVLVIPSEAARVFISAAKVVRPPLSISSPIMRAMVSAMPLSDPMRRQ